MQTIPLFPLHVVLFPGMPLGLHIFEPRYLEMIDACRQAGQPFGVVLIRQGDEAFGPLAEPYRVGCKADISQVEELPDGRLNIAVDGTQRFRVVSLDESRPYLTAEVEDLPLRGADAPEARHQASQLLLPVGIYMNAVMPDANRPPVFLWEPPQGSEAQLFFAAAALQLPAIEKQALLEIEDAAGLGEELARVYRRELALLEKLGGEDRQDAPEGNLN